MEKCDVLIIGGGPSGSLAASKLLKNGFSVIILEKLDFPRFVIGESLLPRCNEILENNELFEVIEQQKYMTKGGAIFVNEKNEEQVIDFSKNLGQKWGTSFQVKREEFDNVLLQNSKKMGADVRHGYEVIAYDNEKNQLKAKNNNGNIEEFEAKFILDASGYGRVLPKLLDLDIPSDLRLRNAIFTRVKGERRREKDFEGFIDIVIHDNNKAWLWVIPFSDGTTSCGIVCEEDYFKKTGLSQADFWDKVINEHVYLKEKFKNAEKIVPVGIIGGYSAAIKKMYGKGYALSGNATEFLDPVFSSGVTLALESSNKVAELIIKELNGEKVNWQNDYEDYMMIGINVFREFVYAWYEGKLQKIFYSKNKSDIIKNSISSILSGYVWDENNYFVKDTKRKIEALVAMSN
ncbi:NAD(P)/FAD-dependent oxidoreductase [Arcobacter aquimarinus]|uniref:NAD(P)/FAD-dependent oxidoreductase n=1 Tax=Arcobacter aquimarinus TaxID=1315211 RepID=A0AAE7E102_9BACT|nr:NAD(P)/FAD-dependent oxidoreductase [Arcobacter aquimarinus]QKE24986.1 NAD(P)/FAD-dependent oxidoreductase [Arcobacter aquimarinus]RXI36773.1 FAD-binding protein [Arcobacter aquimarinus]